MIQNGYDLQFLAAIKTIARAMDGINEKLAAIVAAQGNIAQALAFAQGVADKMEGGAK